ncbi:hypothetical protein [Chryseobacterium sp. IT-36CA2]|uniref:hypothetical protein n=1 Tax=Chryseobacterium sp. IT-36CA2 TaxID=3026460 RepID=UPI0039E1BF11
MKKAVQLYFFLFAIFYSYAQSNATRFFYELSFKPKKDSSIMLFVGLFLKQKIKYVLFILAFIFHFLIFLIHGLGTFWISMTGCLILYCFDPTITMKKNIIEIRKVFSSYKKTLLLSEKT